MFKAGVSAYLRLYLSQPGYLNPLGRSIITPFSHVSLYNNGSRIAPIFLVRRHDGEDVPAAFRSLAVLRLTIAIDGHNKGRVGKYFVPMPWQVHLATVTDVTAAGLPS